MRSVLTVVLAVTWACPLTGQAVVGVVTDAGNGQPVVGAMVRATKSGATVGPRYLTAADGRFQLTLAPGAYDLDVDRIGFSSVRAGPVEVPVEGVVTFDLSIDPAPIRLAGLAVQGARRRCDADFSGGGRTQVIWDQARKALAAASWTEREARLTFEIARRVRRLDIDGRIVRDESRQVARGSGGNSVRTLTPEDLVAGGYVRDEDGYLYYYGPDASVLLSEPFLSTHCFAVAEGDADRPELVGLSFEPVDGRDTTDISGTIWMDESTLRLDRVEFAYTGMPDAPGRHLARGEVSFLELPDGRWIVRDWFIHAPLLEVRRAVGAGGSLRDRLMVTGVQELGSEVLRVDGPDGLLWERSAVETPRRGPPPGSPSGLRAFQKAIFD